jgi:hypothetical protein
MSTKNLAFVFLLLPALAFAQNANYHGMQPYLDGSYVDLSTNTELRIKIDERFTNYVIDLSDVKVYKAAHNPISGFVTNIINESDSGMNIKRGINMIRLTLSSSQANGYYILEIGNSKGEKSFLRFYYGA